MSESNRENKKIKGIGVLISSILTPLNDNIRFQEKFRAVRAKILINASNLNNAALIIIDHGAVKVESIPNKPKLNLKKKKLGWDAFIEMDTQTFLTIAMNKLSILGFLKKMVRREVKMRGIRKLVIFFKVIRFLTNHNK